jgi:hypothetical protein
MLCVDGSRLELARCNNQNERHDEPTAEEVDKWVETFPVQVLSR